MCVKGKDTVFPKHTNSFCFGLFFPSFSSFFFLQYKRKYTGKYYQLLDEDRGNEDVATIDQIERDLNRTFPTHIRFREENGFFFLFFFNWSIFLTSFFFPNNTIGLGQQALGRVLRAYAKYNPKLGYCQGMGFIAALFLMMMEEVIATFISLNTHIRIHTHTHIPTQVQPSQIPNHHRKMRSGALWRCVSLGMGLILTPKPLLAVMACRLSFFFFFFLFSFFSFFLFPFPSSSLNNLSSP